jgi:uncharacterized protein
LTERSEVFYTDKRWSLLKSFRKEAAALMKPLVDIHVNCLVYGSVARGDVKSSSDVEIFLPSPPTTELIEAALDRCGIRVVEREIVQATPGYAAKGYLYTSEKSGYSLPLTPLLPAERDFYSFAGSVTLTQIDEDLRVPGVDKRLALIEPTPRGHMESQVAGHEGEVAKILGVDTRIIAERVRTLDRRREIGRTGVYLKHTLEPGEVFGDTLHRLSLQRPALRKRINKKK